MSSFKLKSTTSTFQPETLRYIALGIFLMGIVILGFYWKKEFPFREENELLHVSFGGSKAFFEDFDAYYSELDPDKFPFVVNSAHAGSVHQEIGIASGLIADVVSFATPLSNNNIAKSTGYIRRNWKEHFPYGSSPFYSTIVFLVPSGNPKEIHDWDDLIRNDVRVMTSDPSAGGSGRYAYLATLLAEKECDALQGNIPSFSHQVFLKSQLVALGANQVSQIFMRSKETDILLTWESEAIRVKNLFPEQVDVIYPAFSILAEPVVAVIDTHVEMRNTRAAAESYIELLYSETGQRMASLNGFRPRLETDAQFPAIDLYSIEETFGGWDSVDELHFSPHGSWELIRQQRAAVNR